MTLSELIIEYRNEHGISQRQMASQCKLSTGYISLIEKETNPQTGKPMVPSLAVLNKLAKGMGITLDKLLSVCDDTPIKKIARIAIMNLPVIQLRPYIAYRLSKLAGGDNLSFLTKLPYGLI